MKRTKYSFKLKSIEDTETQKQKQMKQNVRKKQFVNTKDEPIALYRKEDTFYHVFRGVGALSEVWITFYVKINSV